MTDEAGRGIGTPDVTLRTIGSHKGPVCKMRLHLCSLAGTLGWMATPGLQSSLPDSCHPSRPQEASSRNLVTLRVDSNGFFLYWTGPNMVRAGTGAACSGLELLPQTPEPSPLCPWGWGPAVG